jgi:multimeric flavodoxin WrbA
MKVLILTGSYRKKGNTARLTNLLAQQITQINHQKDESTEISTINLSERNLQPCHGCRVCFDKGETYCPHWDDMEEIKTAMTKADVLILASPVYVEDISGVMKTWIDRLAHVCHRPEFGGKYAYLLTTSGTGTSGHALGTLESALRTWGYHIIGKNNFITGGTMPENEISTHFQPRVEHIARQILVSVKKQKALSPSFVSLLYFKVQQVCWQKSTEDSVDLQYWQARGWTDPHATFYVPHKASWFAVTSARMLGSVIALFFA